MVGREKGCVLRKGRRICVWVGVCEGGEEGRGVGVRRASSIQDSRSPCSSVWASGLEGERKALFLPPLLDGR